MDQTIAFTGEEYEQFTQWALYDRKVFEKLAKLIKEVRRNPFTGTGEPEALKHQMSGLWSRRITLEHRLVYQVTPDHIIILSCKGHYQ